MKKVEDRRQDGVKRVKFAHDTPSKETTKVDEKKTNGVKKVTFTRK